MKIKSEIKKFWKLKIIQFFIFPSFFFIVLVISYSQFSWNLPISYWDEMLWTGRSYFIQFFIHRDFKNPVWQSYESYDQPKLAELMYGIWLYPSYLDMKHSYGIKSYDYTKFLISQGLYSFSEDSSGKYKNYHEEVSSYVAHFAEEDSGFPNDFLRKYGPNSLKTLDLIYKARVVNFFLLASAALFVYYLIITSYDFSLAAVVSVFYSFNILFILTGLKAHSEALFIFLFNLSLFLMFTYFNKSRNFFHLIFFSIVTGLCMSTKLNGIMLSAVFIIVNFGIFIFFEKRKQIEKRILETGVVIILSLIVFSFFNPFVYSNPIQKTLYMFRFRNETVNFQTQIFPDSYLNSPISRMQRVYENFFTSKNSLKFNNFIYFNPIGKHPHLFFGFFLLGIIFEIKQVLIGNKRSFIFLLSFLLFFLITLNYLSLDWDRYYIHLVFFIILYEYLGLIILIKKTLFLLTQVQKKLLLQS
jgi:hypothetical protein